MKPTPTKSFFAKILSIFTLFKYLDVFGQHFVLKLDRKSKFQTIPGAIISTIALVLTILFTYISYTNLVDTKNPTVNQSIRVSNKVPVRQLYDSGYAFAVSAFLENGQHIPISQVYRYGTPLLLVQELDVTNILSGAVGFNVIHFWQFKPCVDVVDKTLTQDFLDKNNNAVSKEFVEKYMLCPVITEPTDFYTRSNPADTPYRKVDINIYPCMIPDNTLCAPLSDVNKLSWKIAFLRTSFNPSIKTNPLTKEIVFEDIQVNVNKEIEYKVSLQGNELYDDDTDFGDQKLVAEYLSETENLATSGYRPAMTTCTMADVISYTCLAYVHVQYQSSARTFVIIRRYSKFFETMGEIGGTIEIIFVTFGFLYYFYNSHVMEKEERKGLLVYSKDNYYKLFKIEQESNKKEFDLILDKEKENSDDIMNMMETNTQMEIFFSIFLKDYHLQLIPLVYFNKNLEEIRRADQEQVTQKAPKLSQTSILGKGYGSRSPIQADNDAEEYQNLRDLTKKLESEVRTEQEFEQNNKPNVTKNFHKLMNAFMMKNIPPALLEDESFAVSLQNLDMFSNNLKNKGKVKGGILKYGVLNHNNNKLQIEVNKNINNPEFIPDNQKATNLRNQDKNLDKFDDKSRFQKLKQVVKQNTRGSIKVKNNQIVPQRSSLVCKNSKMKFSGHSRFQTRDRMGSERVNLKRKSNEWNVSAFQKKKSK